MGFDLDKKFYVELGGGKVVAKVEVCTAVKQQQCLVLVLLLRLLSQK